MRGVANLFIVLAVMSIGVRANAQSGNPAEKFSGFLSYEIDEKGDTVYFDTITPARVLDRLPKQKGREWKKYYRLVHNFTKTWPYALAAEKVVGGTQHTIDSLGLKGVRRDSYISDVQKGLFDDFEARFRKMTVTQGSLLIKLTDRQIGMAPYYVIKDFKNVFAAGFWQGVAKIFGSDMKKPYDPEGEDAQIEALVKAWYDGSFDELYFYLFWEYPEWPVLPEKYDSVNKIFQSGK